MKAAKKARGQKEKSAAAPDRFPVVGLGASAGGLPAFEAFFSGMPAGAKPGMAFVLVQHLAPDHKSILAELVRRATTLEVFEVEDGMPVRPNCAYIIPPGRDMALLDGHLHLLEPSAPRGQRLPVDFFFRSLAQDQGDRAIGIVLSGTGSDGAQGVRAIKGEGGMVMAQRPDTTDFAGMPQSAIATQMVDFQLAPAEMPAQLLAYVAHAFGKLARPTAAGAAGEENVLKSVCVLLRAKTGHDFSQYKPSTINRRVDRRMAVHQIDTLPNYLAYLQQTPSEVDALFHDLLIGVTSFFRDEEAFKALADVAVPRLLADRGRGEAIRVWVAGCSTGEEAYSIAMLLTEQLEKRQHHVTLQLFATDIDDRAITTARAGVYSAGIAADVSPERLQRFFTVEPDGRSYRIKKSIRDLVVFSQQDLLKDPPFSRLDLLSCRNLLIYLGPAPQKRLIPLFHYSLKPTGLLLLGTSEGIGDFDALFEPLDRKAKLYARKDDHQVRRGPGRGFAPALAVTDDAGAQPPRRATPPAKLSAREVTELALLQQAMPAGALVNRRGDVVYLHGRTGLFLEPSPGDAGSSNLLQMAREGLRPALSTALHRASTTQEVVHCPGLQVKTNGHFTRVNATVHPVELPAGSSLEGPLFLVTLEEALGAGPALGPASGGNEGEGDAHVEALRQELRAKEEYLQSMNEELESSTEELRSSNEEMQSVNEELQSTNEELETSKEELQSVNEELATVNNELQTRVLDLSQANNDMNNLLAGTGIGTVFVDYQLRIMRFTPAASAITNLIHTDVGRPVGQIVSNLVGYDRLAADTQQVLDTLVSREVEVQSTAGRWYAMRIQPYRTLENVIEGAVISFIDTTDVVEAREALRKANELLRLAVVVRDSRDPITVQGLDGRTLAWNPAATRLYGWTEAEALLLNVRDRVPTALRQEELARIERLSHDERLAPYESQRLTRSGATVDVSIVATVLLDEAGAAYGIATTERARQPVTGGTP